MTKAEIKKEIAKARKANGWDKIYGEYGIGFTMGTKQMEKNEALMGFGYVIDERHDTKATVEKVTSSEEFQNMISRINGSWEKEIRNVYGADFIYIVIHY